jgi:hypothetical protein
MNAFREKGMTLTEVAAGCQSGAARDRNGAVMQHGELDQDGPPDLGAGGAIGRYAPGRHARPRGCPRTVETFLARVMLGGQAGSCG